MATLSPDDEARSLEALRHHARHPVELQITLQSLMVLIGALNLASRHPQFPRTTRRVLDAFLDQVHTQVTALDPLLGNVVQLGRDPASDVPRG